MEAEAEEQALFDAIALLEENGKKKEKDARALACKVRSADAAEKLLLMFTKGARHPRVAQLSRCRRGEDC